LSEILGELGLVPPAGNISSILAELGKEFERHPAIPDVPRISELGPSVEDKQIIDLYAAGSVIGRVLITEPSRG
jgi:hypothetical protein